MPAAGTPHRNCPTEDIASRFVWTSAPLRRYGSGSSNLRMLRILKIPDQNNWHQCCPKSSKPSDYSVQAAKDDPFRAVLILRPSPKRDQYDSSYPLWMWMYSPTFNTEGTTTEAASLLCGCFEFLKISAGNILLCPARLYVLVSHRLVGLCTKLAFKVFINRHQSDVGWHDLGFFTAPKVVGHSLKCLAFRGHCHWCLVAAAPEWRRCYDMKVPWPQMEVQLLNRYVAHTHRFQCNTYNIDWKGKRKIRWLEMMITGRIRIFCDLHTMIHREQWRHQKKSDTTTRFVSAF